MRFLYSLLVLLCIVASFLTLITLYYLKILSTTELSVLADIGTALSPFITLVAIAVTVMAFIDQQKTNQANKSHAILSQLSTEVKDIKQELDRVSFKITPNAQDTPLNYGTNAARAFLEAIPIGNRHNRYNLLNQGNYAAMEFSKNLLFQLSSIVAVARTAEYQKANLQQFEYKKARQTVLLILQIYYSGYNEVFERIRNSIRAEAEALDDNGMQYIWGYIGIIRNYNELMDELVLLNYVSIIQANIHLYTNLQYSNMMRDRIPNTRTVIANLKNDIYTLLKK